MLKTIFKLFIGAFAVIGLLATVVFVVGLWLAQSQIARFQQKATPKPPEKIVLMLNFREELTESEDPMSGLRSALDLFGGERGNGHTALQDVVQALHRGAKDPRVVGVVGLFNGNLPPLSQSQEIRTALAQFRSAGKFSIAYGPNYGEFGPGNQVYYMASAFEKIWLQPVGNVGLSGMRIDNPFGRAALEKFGVKAHFVQREEYKSAMMMFTEDKMPAPMREEMQAILDSLYGQVVAGVAEGRKLPPETVKALMAKGPYTAKEALEKKLVDQIGYGDEIEKWLDEKHGKKTAKMAPGSYLRIPDVAAVDKDKKTANTPKKPKATIALITARGEIADNGGQPSPLSGGSSSMDTKEIVQAFGEATDDNDIKIILFRVDSPGGSPSASETIRRAVQLAKEKGKKVVVSMGEMAGSGGYWIVMDGDRIFANPATLTGSIGVLGGKIDLSGAYEKLGVVWESVRSSENDLTGMFASNQGYGPEESIRINALLDDTYNTFREKVSAARKIPMEKMPQVSKGRVFTGEQAVKIGLVDELGGLRAALDYSKKELGLQPDDLITLRRLPKQTTPAEKLQELIKDIFNLEAMTSKIMTPELRILLGQGMRPIQAQMPRFRVQ